MEFEDIINVYPVDDLEFQEKMIIGVDGDSFTLRDGWSFCCPEDSQIKPEVGMAKRFYGKGIGYEVRGLFLDGQKVFYRTSEEQEKYHNEMCYGKDIIEWVKRWDEGKTIWSIEMGGLGPGYEQALQITAVEIARHLIDAKYDIPTWKDNEELQKSNIEKIETYGFSNSVIKRMGLSGAQWSAALNIACMMYNKGPIAVMTDDRVKDRHIQISKNFPTG